MSVYVGKDVEIKIQVPAEDEPHTIPAGSPYNVTVDNIPISDRDFDGLANELGHVTVEDTNGNPITPASVTDATGVIAFNAGDAGKNIFVSYSYDLEPHIAQEITVEPKQTIEGVDGLGSSEIQAWAVLLKEVNGSIKRLFKPGDIAQLDPYNLMSNPCASANGGSASLSPGEAPGFPASKAIDSDYSTCAKPSDTAPYDWYLEVTFSEGQQRIDKIVLSMKIWGGGHSTNLKVTYYDGFAWKDYAAFSDTDFPMNGLTTKSYFKTVWTSKIRVQGTLDNQTYCPEIFEVEAYRTNLTTYGMIVSWSQGGSAVKVGFGEVVFPEGSVPSPKNAPVFIVTPFKAQTIKTI